MRGWVTTKLAKQRHRKLLKRVFVTLVLGLILADIIYIASAAPDWDPWKTGAPARPVAMTESGGKVRWTVIPLAEIPKHLQQVVVSAEDVRFRQHAGVDVAAFGEAVDRFREHREADSGAGTISQQLVNNLILGDSRCPLRKWHEMVFAVLMEHNLTKDRILFLYLNTAELGRGVFGVGAAAQAYWRKPAGALTVEESIELAATLSSPREHNPETRTVRFKGRCEEIQAVIDELEKGQSQPD